MKKWWVVYLCAILLFIPSCGWIADEHPVTQEKNPPSQEEKPTEDKKEDSESEISNERVEIMGIENFEEEVTVHRFENEWLSMWYDPLLEIEEGERTVRFHHSNEEIMFSVEYMDDISPPRIYAEIESELLEAGYELYNDFPLGEAGGYGYIFYSEEERISIDLYIWEREGQSIVVRFSIPESAMDQYIPRFEYMVDSIEVVS